MRMLNFRSILYKSLRLLRPHYVVVVTLLMLGGLMVVNTLLGGTSSPPSYMSFVKSPASDVWLKNNPPDIPHPMEMTSWSLVHAVLGLDLIDRSNNNNSRPGEKRHVVLVKVHKAASSTAQSILFRFAMAHDLNMVLRADENNHINETHDVIDREKIYGIPDGETYNVLCNHLLFNFKEISPLFPKDTAYIGTVREPFSQFLSAFVYYSHVWKQDYLLNVIRKNPKDPVSEFIRNADLYESNNPPNTSFVNNRMSVDFGFPLDDFSKSKQNNDVIQTFINQLNNTFDLVLVSEKFIESLVLLRRQLRWTTKDIMFRTRNSFTDYGNQNSWIHRKNYPSDVKEAFYKWASIDTALYDHFRLLLDDRIRLQPPDFHEEVAAVKNLQVLVSNACRHIKRRLRYFQPVHFKETTYTDEFTLLRTDCILMSMKETDIVTIAKDNQKQRSLKSNIGTV